MISKREQLAYGLLAIVLVGSLLLWKKDARKPETAPLSCDLTSIVATVPGDWKIYSNEELDYALFYPTDWTRTSPDFSIGHEVDFHAPDEKLLTTSLTIVKDTRSWEQIQKLYADQWSHDFPGMTSTEVTVGGLHGTRYDYPATENSDIYLRRGSEVIGLTINPRASSAIQEILQNIHFKS